VLPCERWRHYNTFFPRPGPERYATMNMESGSTKRSDEMSVDEEPGACEVPRSRRKTQNNQR